MGYMFLFPYFLAVGLIAELSMLGKDTYRNPLRTRIGWTINCVGNFVGCAVPSGGHGTAIRQWLWRVDLPLKP